MNEAARRARALESSYLGAVRANWERAVASGALRAEQWEEPREEDRLDRVRARMVEMGVYSRERLAEMPWGRRLVRRGYVRRWGLLPRWLVPARWSRRPAVTLIASVVSPVDAYLRGQEDPGPVDLPEVSEHLAEVSAAGGGGHVVIGLCSPTGFTAAVRDAALNTPGRTVVLVEPGPRGGWSVHGGEALGGLARALFDPESEEQRRGRLREALAARGEALAGGAVPVEVLAQDTGLAADEVVRQLETLSHEEGELRVARDGSSVVVYRATGRAEAKGRPMSFVERIRQLFSRSGDEQAKIDALTERRALLVARRDRLYDDIGRLEQREATLLAEGRENRSPVVRRRLAAQLAQVRREIARANTTASMLNQQINIISTHIHNLTLVQQGERAQLPSAEELAAEAAKAEELLERLQADAELVSALESQAVEATTSAEEMAILREFDAPGERVEPAGGRAEPAGGQADTAPAPAASGEAQPNEAGSAPLEQVSEASEQKQEPRQPRPAEGQAES